MMQILYERSSKSAATLPSWVPQLPDPIFPEVRLWHSVPRQSSLFLELYITSRLVAEGPLVAVGEA